MGDSVRSSTGYSFSGSAGSVPPGSTTVFVATTGNIASFAGGAPLAVDGETLSDGDRVLVWMQTSVPENGIYTVTTAGTGADGTWERSTDADTGEKIEAIGLVYVDEGATYEDTTFRNTSTPPITLGVTDVTFVPVAEGDVTGPGVAVADNLASFDGTSGKVIQDSGLSTASVAAAVASSRPPSRVASTGNVDVGVGGLLTIDGVGPLTAGDRVLLWMQTAPAENGIWVVAAGAWSRATDMDSDIEFNNTTILYVQEGDTYADRLFKLTTDPPITVGVTAITIVLEAVDGPAVVVDDNLMAWDGTSTKTAKDSGLSTVSVAAAVASSRPPSRVASTGNVDVGVGGLLTIDGVGPLTAGDRVLLWMQTAPAENGIWVVAAGAWSRATDMDSDIEFNNTTILYVQEGATYADRLFKLTTDPPITVGVTAITIELAGFEGLATIPTGNSLVAGPLGSKTILDSTYDGAALIGSFGSPSLLNPYVTKTDPAFTSLGGGDVVGVAPSVIGNVPVFLDALSKVITDSTYPATNLALATETNQGTAEVATQAETNAGVLDDKIVTPLKLKTALGAAVKTIRFTVAGAGGAKTVDSTTSIPAGAVILDCKVKIVTPFDDTPAIAIGETTGTADLLQTTGENIPTAAGLYSTPQDTDWAGADTVRATLTGTTTIGSAVVTIEYAPTPDA